MRLACSQRHVKAVLVAALTLYAGAARTLAQEKPVGMGTVGDVPSIQTFPEPDPQADENAISQHSKVLRAEIAIDPTTTVRLFEEPTSETVYNSSISIERGRASIATYNVAKMIQHQTLRLVHAALIRSNSSEGMLVCEYEGGAVGAREGFAILRFSPAGFELHTLPLTNFGKVVVFRSKPERAEVWSALPDDAGSNAAPMSYAMQSCRWRTKGYVCGTPKRMPGRFSPGSINDPGIETRP
jgi:hypothetical protein